MKHPIPNYRPFFLAGLLALVGCLVVDSATATDGDEQSASLSLHQADPEQLGKDPAFARRWLEFRQKRGELTQDELAASVTNVTCDEGLIAYVVTQLELLAPTRESVESMRWRLLSSLVLSEEVYRPMLNLLDTWAKKSSEFRVELAELMLNVSYRRLGLEDLISHILENLAEKFPELQSLSNRATDFWRIVYQENQQRELAPELVPEKPSKIRAVKKPPFRIYKEEE